MTHKIVGKNEYPLNVEILINKALFLKQKRKYSDSLAILKKLEKDYPTDNVILGTIGSIFYENKDYNKSIKYFKKTTILNPESELASLALFHSFLFLDKVDEALKELHTYTKSHIPNLYKVTIEELKASINLYTEKQKRILNQVFEKTEVVK